MTVLETQGLAARHAARALAVAGTARKNAALEAAARTIEARQGEILAANAADLEAAMAAGLRPAGRGPHRRHCGGGAAGGRPPRSHRGGDQNGHPAQWTDHRKAPGPPGGDRHHLRGPAQRDGGRRSPLPQVGQRGAPPGRQGGLPLQPGLCGRPAGRPGGGRPAPGLRGPGGRYQPGERQRADGPDGVPGRAHPPGRRRADPGRGQGGQRAGDPHRRGRVPHLYRR